jgi:hypothetical protein
VRFLKEAIVQAISCKYRMEIIRHSHDFCRLRNLYLHTNNHMDHKREKSRYSKGSAILKAIAGNSFRGCLPVNPSSAAFKGKAANEAPSLT